VRPGRVASFLRDTVLRMLPHSTRPGLRRVGRPGPDSPVLLTGNYALTVRRVLGALQGRDAWLLVANSRGINVWCAAAGGHLTHHDVIAVLRSSGITEQVRHRTLVLPQLAATGVERRLVREATGWQPRWGPARLEDLPAFLDRGQRPTPRDRAMRFPLWERLELALTWALPMGVVAVAALAAPLDRATAGIAAATIVAGVAALFAVLQRVPLAGVRRWWTYAGLATAEMAVGSAGLLAVGGARPASLAGLAGACALSAGILSLDLAGTTPWYPGTLNSFRNEFSIELVATRCNGAAECVQVCPRNVLRMDGGRRRVVLDAPGACIRCGACIVQCPEDALRFRFSDGRVVEPAIVRSTRMNLLGRRTAPLSPPRADPPRSAAPPETS
jgi:NAD-dependent dihydropyrimidine dehydrogenase PreA subunit